ncbi:MAG: rhamnogalacturonan acetylesterase, partial [Acidobacteria bacterium]
EGIKANKLSIAKYLVTDAPAFDPRHPDAFENFQVPLSPLVTDVKPLGS